MLYRLFWTILLPEFFKNLIIYIIIKFKFGASKALVGNCYIDLKLLLNGKIKIGKSSYIGEEIRLHGNINIGNFTFLAGSGGEINGSEKNNVNIGNFCSIGKNIFIISYILHNSKKLTTSTEVCGINYIDEGGEVNIGNDVRIGANVTILPGVNIGNGAIIGAGSIVTKNIPDYAIAVGNPARVIKYRFENNVIDKIISSEWWNWEMDKIKNNYNLEFINKSYE